MQSQTILSSALLSLLAAGALGAASTAHAADKMAAPTSQKCYAVNAAYKNDCQSPGHSCAGQDSKARDPQAFVAVPTGLCAKIAGGSLTAGTAMTHDAMKKS
ncbi:BufA1 family periplasmic bufferin-type metallophore [Rhodanobacter lindaniclasticus]